MLVKAYLTGLSHFANETTDSKKPKNANERVMKEFIALLSSPSAIHMPLDYYARILNISPKHLSFISRYSTGFNALHWIDQYTILEAKSLLSNSDLVIYDIATRLHFSNQSVFGRFFKRHTGITPSAFRRERQKMT